MPAGETEKSPSAWTIDSLHEHLKMIIRAGDQRYEERFIAQAEAIRKAEDATERRFESVNEFRAQLTDQAARFMPRIEAEQRIDQLAERIAALDNRLREDVSLINSRLDMSAGRGAGLDKGWGVFVSVAGAFTAVVAVVITIVVAITR